MNAVTECDLWKSTAEVEVDIPSSRGLSFVRYSFHSNGRVKARKPQAGRLYVHCADVDATLFAFLHGNRTRRPTHLLGGRHKEADGIDFDGREGA
jgi:hypothetical protein